MKPFLCLLIILFCSSVTAKEPVPQQQKKIRRLLQIANFWEQKRNYPKTIQSYLQIEKICQNLPPSLQSMGKSYLLGSYLKIGECFYRLGRYSKALLYFQKSLVLCRKIPNLSSKYLFFVYNNLAETLGNLGRYKDSLGWHQKTFRLLSKNYSYPHKLLAINASNRAKTLMRLGRYRESLAIYQSCLKERRLLFKPPHRDLAQSYNDIAALFATMGDYNKAIPYYKRAMDQYKKLGDLRRLSGVSNNLAGAFKKLGRYKRALEIYKKNLNFYRKLYPAPHPARIRTLNNLGNLLLKLGRNKEAKKFCQRAIDQGQKIYSAPHPDLAAAWDNLAGGFVNLQQYKRAIQAYQKSYGILQKIYPAPHPQKVTLLNNISGVLMLTDHIQESLVFCRRAYLQLQRLYPPPPPLLIKIESNLGRIFSLQKKYLLAEQFFQKAFNRARRLYPAPHPILSIVQANLAEALYQNKKIEKAWKLNESVLGMKKKLFQMEWPLLSTSEKIGKIFYHFYDPMSLAIQLADQSKKTEWIRFAFKTVLYWKGLVFRILLREKKLRELTSSLKLKKIFQTYVQLSKKFNNLAYQAIPKGKKKKFFQREMEQLSIQRKALERTLSQKSQKFLPLLKLSSFDPEKIQALLPQSSALLEYISFFDYQKQKENFAVFLVTKEKITLFVLSPEIPKSIQKLGAKLRADQDFLERDSFSQEEMARRERSLARISHNLCNLLFPPSLARAIQNKKLLFLAPDGPIHGLSFGMIALKSKGSIEYFVQKWDFVYLFSGASLLRPIFKPARGLLAMANPDFGPKSPSTSLSFWPSLPASEEEVRDVSRLYALHSPGEGPLVLLGKKATKSIFLKKAPKKKWIHISTHGFFLPPKSSKFSRGLLNRWAFKNTENPLLRSGLVFAGANGGKTGYLCAGDIALTHLEGTRCVVLSACETGLGAYVAGGGSFGFKWAFEYAGARYLVSPLWKIGDRETLSWMNHFYLNLNSPPWKAVLLTQRSFLKRKHTTHPLFWSAFTAFGNPLPLRAPQPEKPSLKKLAQKSPGSFLWIGPLILILMVGIFFLWRKCRKPSSNLQ